MFYVKDKIIPYPNQTILEDVLSRDGEATINSFSPFKGLNKMLRAQFSFSVDRICIIPEDIVQVSKDFSVHKSKATAKGINREEQNSNILEYFTNLEDIEDSFIEKYVLETIIGFKKNYNGQRKLISEMQTVPKVYEQKEGGCVDLSDFLEKEQSFSTEEIIDAKYRLPFLLIQLHRGSTLYKGSLLSFIIAMERYFRKNNNACSAILPRDIILLQVYKVNEIGDIVEAFGMEESTGEIFSELFQWVCGKIPLDIYYQTYVELLKVLVILEIDITKENPSHYSSSYIGKIKNSDMQLAYDEPENRIPILLKLSKSQIAENLVINCERLSIKVPNLWCRRPRLVNTFLHYYSKYIGMKKEISLRDLDIEKGFLKTLEGVFIPINVSSLCNGKQSIALLSITGHLVLLKRYEFFIHYMDVEDAMYGMKEGKVVEWRPIWI